jgi:oligopeptidase A
MKLRRRPRPAPRGLRGLQHPRLRPGSARRPVGQQRRHGTILALRHEQAQLLGFGNYAELSLAPKMARGTDEVMAFPQRPGRALRGPGARRARRTRDFARPSTASTISQPWDLMYYWREAAPAPLRHQRRRPQALLPARGRRRGMFASPRSSTFDVRFEPAEASTPGTRTCAATASSTTDGRCAPSSTSTPSPGRSKQGGAWMNGAVSRMVMAHRTQLPGRLSGLQLHPAGGRPSVLLTHREVETLFHEFGHGLHHMLTRVDYPPWPASTACPGTPSSCRASSWRTGAGSANRWTCSPRHTRPASPSRTTCSSACSRPRTSSPPCRWCASSNSRCSTSACTWNTTRPEAAHLRDPRPGPRPGRRAQAAGLEPLRARLLAHLRRRLRGRLLQLQVGRGPVRRRLLAVRGARHLRRATGRAFRENILEKGGSADAMELFAAFRGREPTVDALLRHAGVAERA